MKSSYRQNRTRLFLLIKGNQDISKASVSRWISYTIEFAYRKLTSRDISFLKIKAYEVRALSSSWAFFEPVPLDEILKAAVWNHSSTFAKFYLRDMSQQAANLQNLGPVVVAQKVVGASQPSPLTPKDFCQPPSHTVHIRGMFKMNCLLSSSSISTWGTIKTNTCLYRAIQYLHNGV